MLFSLSSLDVATVLFRFVSTNLQYHVMWQRKELLTQNLHENCNNVYHLTKQFKMLQLLTLVLSGEPSGCVNRMS